MNNAAKKEAVKNEMSIAKLHEWLKPEKGTVLISGPCSAETREQTIKTCLRLAETGYVSALRAGSGSQEPDRVPLKGLEVWDCPGCRKQKK